jgi:hypothetical protein
MVVRLHWHLQVLVLHLQRKVEVEMGRGMVVHLILIKDREMVQVMKLPMVLATVEVEGQEEFQRMILQYLPYAELLCQVRQVVETVAEMVLDGVVMRKVLMEVQILEVEVEGQRLLLNTKRYVKILSLEEALMV